MDFTIDDIIRATGATPVRPVGPGRLRVTHLADRTGPGVLFFPMGRGFVTEPCLKYIRDNGCSGVVLFSRDAPEQIQHCGAMGVLTLPDPPQGYYELARIARARSPALIIGVTGSSGKSSTKEYLAAILRQRYRVTATRGTENLCSDCAGILLEMDGAADEAAVIEMGFGWAGDIERMADLARPFAAAITLIAPDHLDGVGNDFTALVREKGRIGLPLPSEGVLAVNGDDPGCSSLDRSLYRAHVKEFGSSRGSFVGYRVISLTEAGTRCQINLPIDIVTCLLQPIGEFQAANAAAAALIAHWIGFTPSRIRTGLESARPLERRFQAHRFATGITVIDDTFSATYQAASKGLAAAAQLAGRRRHVAVLTGMAQLAGMSAELHRDIGRQVAALGYDHLILGLTDERTDSIRAGALAAGLAQSSITEVGDRTSLPMAMLAQAEPSTLMYCKGSMYLRIWPEMDQFLAVLRERTARPAQH